MYAHRLIDGLSTQYVKIFPAINPVCKQFIEAYNPNNHLNALNLNFLFSYSLFIYYILLDQIKNLKNLNTSKSLHIVDNAEYQK